MIQQKAKMQKSALRLKNASVSLLKADRVQNKRRKKCKSIAKKGQIKKDQPCECGKEKTVQSEGARSHPLPNLDIGKSNNKYTFWSVGLQRVRNLKGKKKKQEA